MAKSTVKKDEKKEVPSLETSTTTDNIKAESKVEEQVPNLDDFMTLYNLIRNEKEISKINRSIFRHILNILSRYPISKDYEILFLYDTQSSISEDMADKIYAAIPTDNKKPILLILNNKGGKVEPAYLISKTCKENSPKFNVAIPRKAKSAATLISLGANEIHMGTMSELGPIDPQFGGLPALGLTSSLESLAKIVTLYPKSSELFASYLSEKLDLRVLGYFERVSESSMQYAIRLLEGKKLPKTVEEVAKNFVYEYKDHSFVIDKEEAAKFLGETIKVNSQEYELANAVHQFMGTLNLLAGILKKKNVAIIGNCKNIVMNDKEED